MSATCPRNVRRVRPEPGAQRSMPSTLACCVLAILATCAGLSGCGRQEPAPVVARHSAFAPVARAITPIDVAKIQLGKQAASDGTIASPSASFKPHDTIVAAVTTQRPGHDIKLTARWIYGDDRVVTETTKTISPRDLEITDFQVTDDAGWPLGQYKLEMLVNGTRVAVTAFEVVR